MKYSRLIVSAFLCAVLCVVGNSAQAQTKQAQPAGGTAQRAAAPKSLLVGVVDLRSVLQNHPVVADEIPALSMKLQQEQVALAKAQQEAKQKIANMQQEYKFKYGTPEFEEQIGGVRKELSDAEFKAGEAQQKIVAQRTQLLFRAYKDLQAAIQKVAVEKGIIIVHSKVKLAASADANVSEEVIALEEADQNTIVWNRPECDITDAVKAQLEAAVGAPKQKAEGDSPLANIGGQVMNAAQSTGAPQASKTAKAPMDNQLR